MRVANAPRTPMIFSNSGIGDAVRAVAQVRGRDGDVGPEHALAGEHVDELRVDAHLAVRQRGHAADGDVVDALLLPAGRIDLGGGGGHEHHVGARHAFEAAGAFEITLDDLRHVEAAIGGRPRARTARWRSRWDR